MYKRNWKLSELQSVRRWVMHESWEGLDSAMSQQVLPKTLTVQSACRQPRLHLYFFLGRRRWGKRTSKQVEAAASAELLGNVSLKHTHHHVGTCILGHVKVGMLCGRGSQVGVTLPSRRHQQCLEILSRCHRLLRLGWGGGGRDAISI